MTYHVVPIGTWRSLVARIVRDDEVAGSNPAVPTTEAPHCGASSCPIRSGSRRSLPMKSLMTVVTTSDRTVLLLRFAHAVAVVTVALATWAAHSEPQRHLVPPWLDAAVIVGVGASTFFAARFWRIRPISPTAMDQYAAAVAVRTAFALAPASVAVTVRSLGGNAPALIAALAISGVVAVATRPSANDHARHQAQWTEVGFTSTDGVWRTADPDAIPPWEDPDGGHGHELFHAH